MDSPSLEVFKSRPDAVLEELWSQAGALGLGAGTGDGLIWAALGRKPAWIIYGPLWLGDLCKFRSAAKAGAPHVSLAEQRPGVKESSELPAKLPAPADLPSLLPEAELFPRKSSLL